MEKISAVYKITNTVTGEYYVGSSVNVKNRWANHKCSGMWKRQPNIRLYQDFQKYGVDKFKFQILISIMPECLKQVEQDCIELMKPTYNQRNAKGLNVERFREYHEEYRQSDRVKECQKKYQKEYRQSEKGREAKRACNKKCNSRLCLYNGETLTFCALVHRFSRTGIEHPFIEAKKYLIH